MFTKLIVIKSFHNLCKSNHYPAHLKLTQCFRSIIPQLNWKKKIKVGYMCETSHNSQFSVQRAKNNLTKLAIIELSEFNTYSIINDTPSTHTHTHTHIHTHTHTHKISLCQNYIGLYLVWGIETENGHTHTHTHIYTYIFITYKTICSGHLIWKFRMKKLAVTY